MEPRCEHSANNHGSFMTGKQRESGELEKKKTPLQYVPRMGVRD